MKAALTEIKLNIETSSVKTKKINPDNTLLVFDFDGTLTKDGVFGKLEKLKELKDPEKSEQIKKLIAESVPAPGAKETVQRALAAGFAVKIATHNPHREFIQGWLKMQLGLTDEVIANIKIVYRNHREARKDHDLPGKNLLLIQLQSEFSKENVVFIDDDGENIRAMDKLKGKYPATFTGFHASQHNDKTQHFNNFLNFLGLAPLSADFASNGIDYIKGELRSASYNLPTQPLGVPSSTPIHKEIKAPGSSAAQQLNWLKEINLRQIYIAIKAGNLDLIKELLPDENTLNSYELNSESPDAKELDNHLLRVAIKCGKLKIVEHLITKCNANPNHSTGARPYIALDYAVENNHFDIINFLLPRTTFRAMNNRILNSISSAPNRYYKKTAAFILDYLESDKMQKSLSDASYFNLKKEEQPARAINSDQQLRKNILDGGLKILFHAIAQNDLNLIKQLVPDEKALAVYEELPQDDEREFSSKVLCQAIEHKNLKVIEHLLSCHARIDGMDDDDKSPLDSAVITGNDQIFQLLLSHPPLKPRADLYPHAFRHTLDTGNENFAQLLLPKLTNDELQSIITEYQEGSNPESEAALLLGRVIEAQEKPPISPTRSSIPGTYPGLASHLSASMHNTGILAEHKTVTGKRKAETVTLEPQKFPSLSPTG